MIDISILFSKKFIPIVAGVILAGLLGVVIGIMSTHADQVDIAITAVVMLGGCITVMWLILKVTK